MKSFLKNHCLTGHTSYCILNTRSESINLFDMVFFFRYNSNNLWRMQEKEKQYEQDRDDDTIG